MTSAAENLCKTSTRLPWIPPSPEFHVLAFPHCLFGAVFQSYMRCLLGYSPHELMLSHFRCAPVFAILWTVAHQAPLSMGFSRQEYWSGLPWPPPGDLPNLGMGPVSPELQADCFPLSPHFAPNNSTALTLCIFLINIFKKFPCIWNVFLINFSSFNYIN